MDIRNYLLEYFLDKKDAKKWQTNWIAIKCPYCDHNSKKRHLYIRLEDNTAIIYKCFRASCGVAGPFNKKMARKLNIYSPRILEEIDNEVLRYNKFHKSDEYYKANDSKSIKFPPISLPVEEYFKSRTNHDVHEFQEYFRIVSDLPSFIKENKNKLNIEEKKLSNFLNKKDEYIYFFNDTYSMMYYRNIDPAKDKGKISTIYEDKNSFKNHKPYAFYNKGEEKLHTRKNSTTLIIAEGTFDIINTYFHVAQKVQGFFMASNGFAATKKLIRDFSKWYYKPYIVMVSDNDVKLDYYKYKLLPKIKDRISNLVVLYNKNGKDMGDIPKKGFNIERVVLL